MKKLTLVATSGKKKPCSDDQIEKLKNFLTVDESSAQDEILIDFYVKALKYLEENFEKQACLPPAPKPHVEKNLIKKELFIFWAQKIILLSH